MVDSALDFVIIKNSASFKDKRTLFKSERSDFSDYPIVYPLVIFHCIFRYKLYLKKESQEKSDDEIKELLKKAKKIIDDVYQKKGKKEGLDEIDSFTQDHFFILYPTKSPEGIGLTFIDKTKGVYPLIFYADNDDKLDDKGNRVLALKLVFETIIKEENFKDFIRKINKFIASGEEWDKEIQLELMEKYPRIDKKD